MGDNSKCFKLVEVKETKQPPKKQQDGNNSADCGSCEHVWSILRPMVHGAITCCGQVSNAPASCLPFLIKCGNVQPTCCNEVWRLVAVTTADSRRATCNCLKQTCSCGCSN